MREPPLQEKAAPPEKAERPCGNLFIIFVPKMDVKREMAALTEALK
jgi:hypothetical protein